MTNSSSAVTVTPAALNIAVQSSTIATSSRENTAGLERRDSSSAPAASRQQQQQPSMAVELQTLPAAVASHIGLGLNISDGPALCYNTATTGGVSHAYCGVQASQASSMMANEGLLAAALQPVGQQQQQQQQHSRSSSAAWHVLGSTLPTAAHSDGANVPHSSTTPAAAAAARAGVTSSSAAELSYSQHSNPTVASAANDHQQDAAAAPAAPGAGEGDGSSELPLLARELGVTVASLGRLFRADADAEFEQPVWMVVNLQGKIKGSYTAEKMLEFCRRGTLSAAQMVLGIDKNLPYVARQELAFYRPLGQLIVAVHAGARYTPLTEAAFDVIAASSLTPAHWSPLVNATFDRSLTGDSGSDLTSDLCSLNLDDESACGQGSSSNLPNGSGGSGSSSSGDGRVLAAAAASRLRSALQRLCGVGQQGSRRVGAGSKQPLWLYINHLGWCRGPFSGGKVMHAHLCGRLPRNTLVVAYEPELPACMISGDVGQWFRPLGALLDNVANGWTYNTVKLPDVVSRGACSGATGGWEPLVWMGPGSPPPLVAAEQLAPPAAAAAAAVGAGPGVAAPPTALRSGGGLMPGQGAVQVYSTGSNTMQGPLQLYSTGGAGSTMQAPGAVYMGGQAVQIDGGQRIVFEPQEMPWPPEQQQQVMQRPSCVQLHYVSGSYPASSMTGMPGVDGMSKQNAVPSSYMMATMQQQQQQRGVALFPHATQMPSWESGSFPASSSSNALPSASLGSSSTATGHTSLAQHANSGTASPIISLAGTYGDSNMYSAGQYAAAAAARAVDSSFAAAAAPAWWQQQQQQYTQVMGTSSPFLAAMSSAELAGQQPSGVYMVMPNPNTVTMHPAAGFTQLSSGYDISPSPMVAPNCSLPNAAATSAGMMLLLQQQQQQQQHNNSPIQQQQQRVLLDSQTISSSLASAGRGPAFWQTQ